jgi:superfamily II DNA helicase RecQ
VERIAAPPRRAPRQPAAAEVPLDPVGEGIFTVLKEARKHLADGRPHYVVATDLTLRQIAAARPASVPELLLVPGMGPKKVELYGPAFLAVVAAVLDTATAGDDA